MSWRGYSIFGLLLLAVGALMLAPAALAIGLGDTDVAAIFAICALVTAISAGLFLLATFKRAPRSETVEEFGTLLAALLIAPIAAAAPVVLAAPFLPFEAAYFEMVSTFTTTGASIFDDPAAAHPAINLWRALTAWAGGFIVLVMAYALLAPRNLGGFEVRGGVTGGAIGSLRGAPVWAGGREREASGERVAAAVRAIAPIYAALTAAMAILLIIAGLQPVNALMASMGVLSTSGVAPTNEPIFAEAGFGGEVVAALFLILAITRHTYGVGRGNALRLSRFPDDPELRILAIVVLGVAVWLFARHWIGALELGEVEGQGAFSALWGAVFTVLSFAATAGYVSDSWETARQWSGLSNPSLVLFGLAMMGGGVATTAGGVKLLRTYALFKHGAREMERLVRPSSIAGSGANKRGIRREGAQIAWVFVMLFLVALAFAIVGLSLTGLGFEPGVAAAIAAISNTGPLFAIAEPDRSWLTSITPEGRAVLVLTMVLGRVELLALIAMLNPDNWI